MVWMEARMIFVEHDYHKSIRYSAHATVLIEYNWFLLYWIEYK